MNRFALWLICLTAGVLAAPGFGLPETARSSDWIAQLLRVPYGSDNGLQHPVLQVIKQEHLELEVNRSVVRTPLTIGSERFTRGLGTHANSDILLYSPTPMERFSCSAGIDRNPNAASGPGSVVFSVWADERCLHRTETMHCGEQPVKIDIEAGGTTRLHLRVDNAGDGSAFDHADWAEAKVILTTGQTVRLDDAPLGTVPSNRSPYPFSFVCEGTSSNESLGRWRRQEGTQRSGAGKQQWSTAWTEPHSGLRAIWHVTRFDDFPAVEWILSFENTGTRNTGILEKIDCMNVTLAAPLKRDSVYRLHKTRGAPSSTEDFATEVIEVVDGRDARMGGSMGRSSNSDFPFYRIETGMGSLIVAVGWSGLWRNDVACANANLHLTAGLQNARFFLQPGERVRLPRILIFHWPDNTWESNAQFRQLIYKHYAAKRSGRSPMPVVFTNTCFTEYGLGDTATAQNQIALIRALGPLGVEAAVTDAGWMEGSQGAWWRGCGNWFVRRDNYPDGMAPVAEAAYEEGMIYGLWAEVETVVKGTWIHRNHPQWLLDIDARTLGNTPAALLNFGVPQVGTYMAEVMAKFTELPGFGFYRQDFGLLDPTPFWRKQDGPDRQGIAEIKYICGLYDYWERIARACPNGLREECAAGGRRIDLETVMRMHIHQKTDYWFDSVVDQASIWALSQYLPNNCFVAQLNRLDDYSFHSTLASSLCLGWTADKESFDSQRGKELIQRYKQLRHLLVGAWYPLTPYSRHTSQWLACQYHGPDVDEGMILAFRRSDSPYRALDVTLQGLDPKLIYEISSDRTGAKQRYTGAELMTCYTITLDERHSSDLIVYREVQ